MKQMKQLVIVFVTVAFFAVSGLPANAQSNYEEGQIAISGGISYGFDIEDLGIRVGATYFLNETMRVGADITYWLVDTPSGMSATYLEFNGNFNYIFYAENELMIYGIGALGIHYMSVSYDDDHWNGWGGIGDFSDTDLGLGLGVGIEYNLGGVSVFAEPKIFLSGFDQAKFNAGVRFYL